MASCSYQEETALSSDSDSDDETPESEYVLDMEKCPSESTITKVLTNILQEDLVTLSSKGDAICAVCKKCLEKTSDMNTFTEIVSSSIKQCYGTSGRVSLSSVWRRFHVVRLSSDVKSAWKKCMLAIVKESNAVTDITLQLVLRRTFQTIVKEMTCTTNPQCNMPQQPLTARDMNVIRYMAGYVVVKLKKKFPLFSDFFMSLKSDSDRAFESICEYSTYWTEQIDRGGLYHVNTTFFDLVTDIEVVCRRYLDTRIPPVPDIIKNIKADVFQSGFITQKWDTISTGLIPPESSGRVLKAIVCLWSNIRVHSFTSKWADQLDKGGHAKGTRKTLKRKGTEKEAK